MKQRDFLRAGNFTWSTMFTSLTRLFNPRSEILRVPSQDSRVIAPVGGSRTVNLPRIGDQGFLALPATSPTRLCQETIAAKSNRFLYGDFLRDI